MIVVDMYLLVIKYEKGLYLVFILCKSLATKTEVHGSIHFISNDGSGIGGGALYLTSMAQLQLFQGANLTFEGNTGV